VQTGHINGPNSSTSEFFPDTQRSFSVSQKTKYIAPSSSSLYTSSRKSVAVGKSSYKQGLPVSTPLSYKNYNVNDTRHALRMIRGGGTVAPAKKGSIYNTSLCNGKICALGENVRSTY
jgi:hypothetical protein